MLALEAELEAEEPVKEDAVEVVEAVKVIEKEAKNVSDKALEEIQESNPEAKIEETANGRKVMVFENKSKAEKTTAEKAKQAIASVRKTEKEVEVSKEEELTKEKEVAAKSDSEENKTKATYYTVVKGNSLWSIANQHGMTVDAIKKLNNLKNNNLDIGQKLKVTPKK